MNLLFLKTGIDVASTDNETGEPYVSDIFGYKAVPRSGTKDDNRMTLFIEDTSYCKVSDGNLLINREAVSGQIAHIKEVIVTDAAKKGVNCFSCPERTLCRTQSFSDEYWTSTTKPKGEKFFSGELSAEQQAVVDDCYGKVAVIAPPGSGKTHTLIGIADRMLTDGVKPDDMLILAFSNAAKDEVLARLSSRHKKLPEVSTIHSFAWDLLKRYQGRAYGFEPVAAGKRQQAQLIFACLNEYGTFIKGLSYKKGMLIDAAGTGETLKKCLELYDIWTLKGVEGLGEWNAEHKDGEVDVMALDHIFKRYVELLRSGHFVTYDDMILDCVDLLTENADIAARVRKLHPYVIVDEYQDVNEAEGMLVDLISDKNLVVVGDDDQSIYRFKGSNSKWLLEFKKRHKAKLHVLSDNYRSTAEVIAAAEQVIEASEEDRIAKKIATHKDGARPVLNFVKTKGDAPGAVQEIVEGMLKSGIPLKDIAVIARSNEQLEQIKAVLSCPCHLNRALVVNDPMFITLTFLVKASVLGLDECNKEFFRALTAADPVLTSAIPVEDGNVYNGVLDFLHIPPIEDLSYWNNISQEEDDRLSNIGGHDYRYVLDLLELCKELNELARHNTKTRSYLAALKVITDREDHVLFSYLDEKMEEDTGLEELRGLWNEIRDMSNFADDTRFDISPSDSVTLTTAHDSKGREWEAVIVYDVDSYLHVNRSTIDESKKETLADARRLLYVAMTRSKSCLSLLAVEDRGSRAKEDDYIFSRELSVILSPQAVAAD